MNGKQLMGKSLSTIAVSMKFCYIGVFSSTDFEFNTICKDSFSFKIKRFVHKRGDGMLTMGYAKREPRKNLYSSSADIFLTKNGRQSICVYSGVSIPKMPMKIASNYLTYQSQEKASPEQHMLVWQTTMYR